MLVKGILFGIVISIVSLVVYLRKTMPGGAIDFRSLEQFGKLFFGGMGIGIGIIVGLIFVLGYALRTHGQHMAGM
jgi:hypothetical protein